MLDSSSIHTIAQLAHDAVHVFEQSNEPTRELTTWDKTDDLVRIEYCRQVKLIIATPEITVEALHQQWVTMLITAGWVCGAVLDMEAKTHPMMVAFELLPSEHQTMLHIFVSTVKAASKIMTPATLDLEQVFDSPTSKGFNLVKDALQNDPGYAWSWHCNIAMAVCDSGVSHALSNKAAACFMQRCFDVDTLSTPEYQSLDKQFKAAEAGEPTEVPERFNVVQVGDSAIDLLTEEMLTQGMEVAPEHQVAVGAFRAKQIEMLNERRVVEAGDSTSA